MALVTLPGSGITDARIRLVRDDNPLGSFTGAEVIVEGQEAIWFLEATIQPVHGAEARAWRAALTRLGRLVNTFQMTPPGQYSARRNLLTYTEDLANAAWAKNNTSIGAATFVNSGVTLQELVENAGLGVHAVEQNSADVAVGSAVTASVDVKENTRDVIRLFVQDARDSSIRFWAEFDLSDGTIAANIFDQGGAAGISASITDQGSGVYRCSVTGIAPAATKYRVRVYIWNLGTAYTGDGSSSIFVGAPQLELGTTATDYQPWGGPKPLIAGASQLGRAIDCDDVAPSALIAPAGNFLSVNGELKMIVADAVSNASGEVTFDIEPALRNSPADNAEVEIDNPVGEFRLLSPIAEWGLSPKDKDDDFHAITIAAREVF